MNLEETFPSSSLQSPGPNHSNCMSSERCQFALELLSDLIGRQAFEHPHRRQCGEYWPKISVCRINTSSNLKKQPQMLLYYKKKLNILIIAPFLVLFTMLVAIFVLLYDEQLINFRKYSTS